MKAAIITRKGDNCSPVVHKKICHMSISGLFDLMTLNTCHVSLSSGITITNCKVDQLSVSDLIKRFTANTLRYAVTLTFDLLNLNT